MSILSECLQMVFKYLNSLLFLYLNKTFHLLLLNKFYVRTVLRKYLYFLICLILVPLIGCRTNFTCHMRLSQVIFTIKAGFLKGFK